MGARTRHGVFVRGRSSSLQFPEVHTHGRTRLPPPHVARDKHRRCACCSCCGSELVRVACLVCPGGTCRPSFRNVVHGSSPVIRAYRYIRLAHHSSGSFMDNLVAAYSIMEGKQGLRRAVVRRSPHGLGLLLHCLVVVRTSTCGVAVWWVLARGGGEPWCRRRSLFHLRACCAIPPRVVGTVWQRVGPASAHGLPRLSVVDRTDDVPGGSATASSGAHGAQT